MRRWEAYRLHLGLGFFVLQIREGYDATAGRSKYRLSWFDGRRKKKAVHKTTTTDDKRLQNTLKRLGVNTIPGIEEVNIFVNDDVIHFTNPKGEGQKGQL